MQEIYPYQKHEHQSGYILPMVNKIHQKSPMAGFPQKHDPIHVFLYPLLGYLIDKAPCHNDRKDALKYSLTAILPLCVIVPACLIFEKDMDLNGDFMDAIQCLTLMIGFGIFGFRKSIDAGNRHAARLEKAVLAILYILLTFILGVVFIVVMKKIPILKRLI